MKIKIRKNKSLLLVLLFVLGIIQGCYVKGLNNPETPDGNNSIKKLVVIGFNNPIAPGEKTAVIKNPLTGSYFKSNSVPEESVQAMTDLLFEQVIEKGGYDLISPSQARGVFSSLLSENLALIEREAYIEIGKSFSADAVILGYIYRFDERQGTDYAIQSPASVSFDLYMLRIKDGKLVWKDYFEKTQRSLSENLLDFSMFIKSKGKWVTAPDLFGMGLETILKKMPKGSYIREDK